MQARTTEESWSLSKPAVRGTKGMVAGQHYLATEVGLAILKEGGNAIDAAIATGLMLGVVEPWMSGYGGGGYLLAYLKAEDRVVQVEFGMRAPFASHASDYPLAQDGSNSSDAFNWPKVIDDRNIHGPLAIATPGYLKGIELAARQFGTLPLKALIEPARQQAMLGLPIDWFASQKINQFARGLRAYEGTRSVYLKDGLPPAADLEGLLTHLPLPNLAETLSAVQDEGSNAFYQGALTQQVLQDLNEAGSKITAKDLAQYEATLSAPLHSQYRGHDIFSAGPLTAGPSLIQALKTFETMHPAPAESPDAAAYLAMAKALQTTYADRLENLGEGNLSGSTTHICTADSAGNLVSFTQTIMSAFGARILLPSSGILMNNGMMWFDPRPGGGNSVEGGRRPLCNMCPTLGRSQDGHWFAVGACGGRKIFPSVFQLAIFLSDYGLTVQDAAHQGRIDVSGTELVTLMAELPETIRAHLQQNLSQTRVRLNGVSPNHFALPQVIQRSPNGALEGACFIPSPHAKVSAF